MAELSPMMKQYFSIKENYEDSILFFRLGDFYEMFFDDAKTASEELDLVLTGRDCGQEERAPMCGVPFHSCEGYIARLVERGYKVAICEQTEDPAAAKGIVKRDVVKIITPGTVFEANMLEEGKNNYLCAVSKINESYGVCFADASTGELKLTEISGDSVLQRVTDELGRFAPKEVLLSGVLINSEISAFVKNRLNGMITARGADSFNIGVTADIILNRFGAVSIENLGFTASSAAASALGAVVEYLVETGKTSSLSINRIDYYTEQQFMRLDLMTLRNLEITETMRTKSKKGSLLWVLDKTKTAMGKRLLRSWAEKPLMDLSEINNRQNAVEQLMNDAFLRGEIAETLSGVRDIERIITKTVYGTANAKDLRTLCESLKVLPQIKDYLSAFSCRELRKIDGDIDLLDDIKVIIDSAIEDDPPFSVREGGMIKKGYNAELDELHDIVDNGKNYIADIETAEREKTGIKNLRIRYNRVFGYYIEVTNSFLDKVPAEYIRKQTLTNCERYITEELKKVEGRVLGAHDRINTLEYEIFSAIRKKTADEVLRFQKTATALSRLDVLCSFALVSVNNSYVRPKLNTEGIINIEGGRHAVVEKLSTDPFVSNDTYLNLTDNRCAIITGPNMAGKSTYMRQVAIISVLAQMGCFVPAVSANLCIVDAVFTRVGASDDLASGQSTFMLEMSEVATIVKNATRNSLLIFDEIGRGTSTYDGMAIARAVLEFVANKKTLGAKSLFATHYHELTQAEQELEGVKNYNIAAKKRNDNIIFLRRIVPGGADESYGIEVAKLAGVPDTVINRAKVILKELLQNGGVVYSGNAAAYDTQIPMEAIAAEGIMSELKAIDVNTLSPIEALQTLHELSKKAKSI